MLFIQIYILSKLIAKNSVNDEICESLKNIFPEIKKITFYKKKLFLRPKTELLSLEFPNEFFVLRSRSLIMSFNVC